MPWIQCQQVYNQQKKSKLSNCIFKSGQFPNSKTSPGSKLARSRAVSWREWVEASSRALHAYSRIRRSMPETNCHVTILRLQEDILLISRVEFGDIQNHRPLARAIGLWSGGDSDERLIPSHLQWLTMD